MKKSLWFTFVLVAALMLGFGSSTLAAAPDPPESGKQARIDNEAGDLGAPTASERAQMAAKWREIFGKAKIEPKVFTYKNGMMAVELDPSMFKYAVARIDADGNLSSECAQGTETALELIETVPDTPVLEEK